jgi:hypothetical protein
MGSEESLVIGSLSVKEDWATVEDRPRSYRLAKFHQVALLTGAPRQR